MGKCLHEASEGRWDHVVVDAAPTGQIESLLGAPAVIGDLVGRGPVHDQARHLEAQLSDSGLTALVAVATPGELALTEAAEFLVASRRMGLAAPVRIVLNRLITEPAFTAPPEASGSQRDAAVLTLRLFDRQQTLLRGWEHPDASLPFVHGADPPAVRRTMAEVLGS